MISASSTNCSPTTSWTTPPSLAPLETRPGCWFSTTSACRVSDFRPEIGWQTVDGDIVTTFKVYHGTHPGDFLGIAPTGQAVHFETVDAMRVRDGKITDHWGVANLYSVLQQLGQLPSS